MHLVLTLTLIDKSEKEHFNHFCKFMRDYMSDEITIGEDTCTIVNESLIDSAEDLLDIQECYNYLAELGKRCQTYIPVEYVVTASTDE